jgi:hypothetical protein
MNDELHEGIKLVRGNPSAEELAAAIAVVEAMIAEEQATAGSGRQQPKSTWNRNSVNLRGGLTPGFGQWKASFRDGLN